MENVTITPINPFFVQQSQITVTKSLVKDVQIANKVKSKLKKLLVQLDQTKQGFVPIDAFFQMLELHEINLKNEDRQKLRKLCETKANNIKYKDALALIQVNKDLESPTQGFWILQIPMRKDTSKKYLTPQKDDTRS